MTIKKIFAIMLPLYIVDLFAVYNTVIHFNTISRDLNWKHFASLSGAILLLILSIFLTYQLKNKK